MLKLYLFGSPRLMRDDDPIHIRRRRGFALLIYLAMTQRPHSREALANLLWSEYGQGDALANLRRELARLRKDVGADLIKADRKQIWLNKDEAVWVDCHAFEQHLAARQLDAAANLATADFLVGFSLTNAYVFEEWVLFERERRQEQLGNVLAQLIANYLAHGEDDADATITAVLYAKRWLALNPFHEPAHRALMQLYALRNQRSAALDQYQQCVDLLAEELAVEPESETTTLWQIIRKRDLKQLEQHIDPGLPAAQRPTETAVASVQPIAVYQLPHDATPFVGRQQEQLQLRDLLLNKEGRLVTLSGAGGMGKTRLALAVAHRLAEMQAEPPFPDGIYWVELAALQTADLLLSTIAQTLNIRTEQGHERLYNHLQNKRMLLILDNFEHLLDATPLVESLLQASNHLSILITSQERLKLREEQVFQIWGLDTPTEEAHQSGASALFLKSARRIAPDFVPTAEDWPAIIKLCQLVAGMPLALEMAAAWIDLLSPAEIVAEIGRNFDFLATDLVNVPQRHRSIRVTITTSWQRLTADQQQQLAQLSIFRGGFTRQAAQEVAGVSLRTLSHLVNKSFLAYHRQQQRYDMHEMLRQFTADQLQNRYQADEAALRPRFANYFVGLLAQEVTDLIGGEQLEAAQRIQTNIDNIRPAWRWMVREGEPKRLVAAAQALGLYFQIQGNYLEGVQLFEETLTTLQQARPSAPVDKAMVTPWMQLGFYWLRFGQLTDVERAAQQCLVLHEKLSISPLPGHISDPAILFAYIALRKGEYRVMQAYAEQICEVAVAMNHPINHQLGLHLLASASFAHGNYVEARQFSQQAFAIAEQQGDRWYGAYILNMLGTIAMAQGDYEMAESVFHQSQTMRQGFNDRESTAFSLYNLGAIALKRRYLAEAEAYFAKSLQIYRRINDNGGLANAEEKLGQAAFLAKNYEHAWEHYQTALIHAQAGNFRPMLLALFVSCAELLWTISADPQFAVELLQYALENPATPHQTQQEGQKLFKQIQLSKPELVTNKTTAKSINHYVDVLLALSDFRDELTEITKK